MLIKLITIAAATCPDLSVSVAVDHADGSVGIATTSESETRS